VTAALAPFAPPTAAWFAATFAAPTPPQVQAWPAIARGEHVLLVAPTGSGKTLAAFLAALDRLLFGPRPAGARGTRVVYVSPIKALAVDVERNLMAPLAGIRAAAEASGTAAAPVTVAVRSGDTSARERRAIARGDADVLITTPESLYLMLTSAARSALRTVEVVIVDEIHALCGNERGAHLALSLERLELLTGKPLQRIGLSATQRPLAEVARFLAGARPVTIVDAAGPKQLALTIEMPFAPGAAGTLAAGPAASNWERVFPRLVELVRAHTSTLVFVNSRRLAERTAGAMNELAGEVLVHAHHGSVAKEQRAAIEDALKRGRCARSSRPARSSSASTWAPIDLVVQVESPPSVARGLQRVGRAGHQVGGASRRRAGPEVPRRRAGVPRCWPAMRAGEVETSRCPQPARRAGAADRRDVRGRPVDGRRARTRLVTRAAGFAELPRAAFDRRARHARRALSLDEFAELRPRITWDRQTGVLTRAQGRANAVVSAAARFPTAALRRAPRGERPARASASSTRRWCSRAARARPSCSARRPGGSRTSPTTACSCRRRPGEPGKMPFWRGEGPGRPIELGKALGAFCASSIPSWPAMRRRRARWLKADYKLDELATDNLIDYLGKQREATGAVPTDRAITIERFRDELGDVRVCILSPFGSRIHGAVGAGALEHAARGRRSAIRSIRCTPTTASRCGSRRRRAAARRSADPRSRRDRAHPGRRARALERVREPVPAERGAVAAACLASGPASARRCGRAQEARSS
jgi:ATP-dependent Lhr-like helicase